MLIKEKEVVNNNKNKQQNNIERSLFFIRLNFF